MLLFFPSSQNSFFSKKGISIVYLLFSLFPFLQTPFFSPLLATVSLFISIWCCSCISFWFCCVLTQSARLPQNFQSWNQNSAFGKKSVTHTTQPQTNTLTAKSFQQYSPVSHSQRLTQTLNLKWVTHTFTYIVHAHGLCSQLTKTQFLQKCPVGSSMHRLHSPPLS